MPFFSFGKNTLTTKVLFKERDRYEFITSQEVRDKKINIWFNKIKFGRVDYSNNPVYVSTSRLKQIKTNNDNIFFLLDFAADAFNDFSEFYNPKIGATDISPVPTPYSPIVPSLAWQSADVSYKNHIVNVYDTFGVYLNNKRINNKITDFDSFVVEFIKFIDEALKSTKVTRSGFTLSEEFLVSPLNSGLAIEIAQKNPSNDLPKLRDFIYNKNFNAFKNAAARFGFVVDINVPWRLIADIESKPMQFYMSKNGIIDSQDMFDKCFFRTYLNEIEIIKNMFFNYYNIYVTNAPTATKIVNRDGRTRASLITREPITNAQFSKIDDLYWIRVYTFLRAKEMKCGLNQVQFDELVTKAFDLKNGLDFFASLGYINKQVKAFSERNTINALEGRFVPNTFRIKG